METKVKGKILAILMSLAMAFTMMPMMGTAVYADDSATKPAAINIGPDVLGVGANTSCAATVHMAGTKWRVIGYRGTGTASSGDTMTLIASDNLKTGIVFDSDSMIYEGSNLNNEVNKLTHETDGIFSAKEKEVIVPRDLDIGEFTDSEPYTNGVKKIRVENALLWPLSTQEAYYMDGDLRKVNNSWWLRSPGIKHEGFDHAAGVSYDGDVEYSGFNVWEDHGLRPAFSLDPGSVILISAAAGGKSAAVGADSITKIGGNNSGEWKLTLKDGAHERFSVASVTKKSNKKLNIRCRGTVQADKEYVSAIIKTKNSEGGQYVSRYGKITKTTDLDNAEYAVVELPDDLEAGDEIYVFNEHCNADAIDENDTTTSAETDYASKLVLAYTAPNAEIVKQPTDLTLNYDDATGNELSVQAVHTEEDSILSYQWYYKENPDSVDSTKIDNATDPFYTVPTDQNVGKSLYYYCIVTEKDEYGGEVSTRSDLATVTVNKADLTIKAKDQTFTYNGKSQGPGEITCDTQEDIAKYVDVQGLKNDDCLESVNISGQGTDAGDSELVASSARIVDDDDKDVTGNYNISYEEGNLSIAKANVKVTAPKGKTFTYNGNAKTGVASGTGYTLSGTVKATKAGTFTAKATLKTNANYVYKWADGTTAAKSIKWKINKAANPLSVKAKTATVKYSAVKKKAQVIGVTKVIAFTKKGQGKMTYTKASGNKKITIAKTTGKVTVKKGLKKGTYKVRVKVKAAGNANYKASAVKTVTFKIKVK